ncbi:MAG: aquaporin [Streptococcaceae bacterium]|jgi:aquaporin Z|nr:aquaporin [Streptococcaceae bacterium]
MADTPQETEQKEMDFDLNDKGDVTAEVTTQSQRFAIAPLIAEFAGTFLLVGIVIRLAQQGTLGALGIALFLSILIVIFGGISGAHLNPAITLAQFFNRKMDGGKTVLYIIAQVLGALLALAALYALYKYGVGNKVSFIHVTVPKGKIIFSLLAEMFGSFIFGIGVGHAIYATDKPMLETGLSVGFGLFGGLMIGGSTTALNPAVATAIGAFSTVNKLLPDILVYFVGTTVGMTLGVTAYRFLREMHSADK